MEHKELELKHISIVNNKKYFISTIKMQVRHSWLNQHDNTFVYETMIFKTENEKVIYHEPVFNKRYNNYDKAINGHQDAIDDIKFIIEKDTQNV